MTALTEDEKLAGAGWIKHDGKGMPVDGETLVHVRFFDGSENYSPCPAIEWDWGEDGPKRITHYRIVSPNTDRAQVEALGKVADVPDATPETGYVLMKRGLYYRPNAQGYTGLLSSAGVYSDEESEKHVDPESGVSRLKFSEAPEVTQATWLETQRDYWREEALRLRAMLAERAKK